MAKSEAYHDNSKLLQQLEESHAINDELHSQLSALNIKVALYEETDKEA